MPETTSVPDLRRLQAALLCAAFGALFVLLIVKVMWVGMIFHKPGEMTYPAASCVYVARRVQQGGPLYGDWRLRPHVPTWYGPALYMPVAYLGRWLGADVHGLYMIGRTISLLATLGTAGLIAWLVARARGAPPVFAAMMAVAFFTPDQILASFDMSFRADAPACFLTMLGLALVVRSTRRRSLYVALAIFMLAFLYKQSAVYGPIAVILWLWASGRRREAVYYTGTIAVLILVYSGVSQIVTDGRFALNTVDALKGNTTVRAIPMIFHVIAKPAIVPLAMATFVVVTEWARRQWCVLSIAFVVTTVLTAISTLRDGSSVNYYMPTLAIACVLCGRRLGRWWRDRTAEPGAQAVGVGLTLALSLTAVRYVPEAAVRLAEMPARVQGFAHRRQQYRVKAELISQLSSYLNALPGPVLCEFNDMVLHCPRSILVDMMTFSGMADVGVFDDRELLEQIRRGEVSAIVIDPKMQTVYQSTDFLSARWREAMRGRYQVVRKFPWAQIYRPVEAASRPVQRQAEPVE